MDAYTCKFCGKAFQRKYNLQVHQKKTRYCLEKQNSLKNEQSQVVKDGTQVMLLDMIAQLQQTIVTMATAQGGGNTVNNRQVVLNNLQPLTEQ